MIERYRRFGMKSIGTETTFGIGTIEGNVYRNKFFSVEYVLPEGFSFFKADQLAEMNSAIIRTNKDQTVLKAYRSGSAFFDMAAAAENDPNTTVVIQIAGHEATDMDETAYFEAGQDKIIEQLNNVGATVKSTEIGHFANEKTGDKFAGIKLILETKGTSMYEEILCIKAGDYFMNITATANNETGLVSVLNHLVRIRK